MKILILANNDIGLYKFRKELIEELLIKGHKIYISLPDGDLVKPLEEMGCRFIDTPIDRRGINPILDCRLFRRYMRIMRDVNPDMVITYTIKPNLYGGIVARLFGKEYFVNITGLGTAFEKNNIIRRIVILLYKYALKKVKIVFVENVSIRDVFLSLGCCKKEKITVLNGAGVNTETYCYLPYPNNDTVRFLFVGRVMKEKGINELLKAVRRLVKEGEACHLDIVGPFEEDYKNRLAKYKNEGWLDFYGYQEDVRPFIKECDCFVLPSYHEGMANTNLECASSGRPIITSNIPGCREAVIEGVSGFLCKPKDVESLYNALKKMLHETEREKMGILGRKHMIKMFSKDSVVKTTISKLLHEEYKRK